MIDNTNDGSVHAPRLCCYMNELALNDMAIPVGGTLEAIRAAGYDGFQAGDQLTDERREACRRIGLQVAGSGRVNAP